MLAKRPQAHQDLPPSRNFLMRSREESSLKTNALRYLADAGSERLRQISFFEARVGRESGSELTVHRYVHARARIPPDFVIPTTPSLEFVAGILQQTNKE
jgi:hypothetical protein